MTFDQVQASVEHVLFWVVGAGISWTPFASAIAAKVARPTGHWARLFYDLLVDMPAWCAALGRSGVFGGKFNMPLVPSRLPGDNPPKNRTPPLELPTQEAGK